ncbi:hypothetical protein HZH68_011772 [Vespula germanica]|uniref:Uncharacterized protein n=1 Tax=Vespula germanica TaxID=30212 RepID=A0A834MZ62_VESGE|nr:hypothetical protein HZH68_011772 [Vespula germanica]
MRRDETRRDETRRDEMRRDVVEEMISSVLDEFTSCQSAWSNSRHAASKAPANSNSNSSADNSRLASGCLTFPQECS